MLKLKAIQGRGHTVERVARCRITFINRKNIISFFVDFNFSLIYVQLHNGKPRLMQQLSIISYITHTFAPYGSVLLTICSHLCHVFSASHRLVLTLGILC
jgi:hypothetical protein